MKEKVFNIIQIGDKSNRISRAFDVFITITIFANIAVTVLLTFQELAAFFFVFHRMDHSVYLFCRVCTAHLDGRLSLSGQERIVVSPAFSDIF